MAVDAAGNLYLAQAVTAYSPGNAVVKQTWTGSGYTQSTVATGLAYPVGVAVDGAGNVYIADQDNTNVLKMTPTTSGYTPSVGFTNLGNVEAVAVDGSGNVYISSLAYGLLKETLAGAGYIQSTIARTVYAFGIAVDGAGNLYLDDSPNGQVLKETLSNGTYTQSTVASGSSGPLAMNLNGNVYVAFGNQLIKETLSNGSYTQSTVAGGLNNPSGVAIDGSGNVFICSNEGSSVWKVDLAGPPSLSFATTVSGSTSSDSPKIVTVSNAGNATLNIPIPSSGNNPSIASNFTLDSSGASACPFVDSAASSPGILSTAAKFLPFVDQLRTDHRWRYHRVADID